MDGEPLNGPAAAIGRATPVAHYQQIDRIGRIDGATPHALVAILYGELSLALDVIARATESGDRVRLYEQHARAGSILHALEAGLDRVNGGALAISLGDIYRQMGRRLLSARTGDRTAVSEIKAGVTSLADAWSRVAA